MQRDCEFISVQTATTFILHGEKISGMNIKQGFPPNIEKIRAVFPDIAWRAVFTYGDTLYIQDNKEEDIVPHLHIHEETHVMQQGNNPEDWWDRYLTDVEFRLQQEIEAYGRQYAYVKSHTRGDTTHKQVLFMLAGDLSSPMYGNLLDHNKAEASIRLAAKNVVQN